MDIQKKFELTLNESVDSKSALTESNDVKSSSNETINISKTEIVIPEPSFTNDLEENLDLTEVGQKIAEKLEEYDYHPVVIFGSSNSGKSSLLGSLLGYFQIDTKGVGIYLGDPIIPTDTPHGKWMYEEAESFFGKGVQEFLDGIAHAATKTRHPFFIPIRVVPPNLPEIKFAFMESNGEWYKPRKDTGRYFPELKAEINAILKHYQKGISFIHVAPYTQINVMEENKYDSDTNTQEINDASLAIVGALNSYEQLRIFKDNDTHMFLITKWDASAKNNILGHLQFVETVDVETIARTLYTRGFAAFNNLHIDPNQKNIMQYCSGLISGKNIIKANSELKPILDKYPQTMWNWLYGNATELNSETNRRLALIPKILPPKKSIFDHISFLINKILS